MKKKVSCYLSVIIGAILLAGLIASCGDGPEPQFKVIESKEYNDTNLQTVGDSLWYKYFGEQKCLTNSETILAQYKKDVDPLITNEMNKKNPAVGLFIVIKMDQYKLFALCHWDNKPDWKAEYWVFDN